jgi:hypothetical protein
VVALFVATGSSARAEVASQAAPLHSSTSAGFSARGSARVALVIPPRVDYPFAHTSDELHPVVRANFKGAMHVRDLRSLDAPHVQLFEPGTTVRIPSHGRKVVMFFPE